MLTENEVVTIVRSHLETLFPRQCPCCARVFPSLKEYLTVVAHIGAPVCWEMDREQPFDPDEVPSPDAMAFSNCPCGTTMTLGNESMNPLTQWRLVAWGAFVRIKRGISTGQLLAELRAKIDAQVLSGRS
jgi:hypothetical protein